MRNNTKESSLTIPDKQKAVEQGLRYKFLFSNRSNQPMNLLDRMAHYNVNGVSIAVINNGELEWANAYGISDIETKHLVTKDTLFQAGSISKSITALGILLLVQEGKIDLDVDVNQYLKSWHLPDNEFTVTEKVTLRRVLSHSAGLTVSGFPGYHMSATIPSLTQILDGVNPPANTEPVRVNRIPGTKWSYSGGGTTIAQLLIEDITGQPFHLWMEKNVLNKLEMSLSTFDNYPNESYLLASGHNSQGKYIDGKHHIYPEMAAAGLWSTATDIAKFVMYIQNIFSSTDSPFLKQDLIREMLKPQIYAMGKSHSGLGVFLENLPDETVFEHAGQDHGFIANYRGLIHQKCGFSIMMNSYENGWYLMEEISNSIADVYGWKNFSPTYKTIFSNDKELYQTFKGTYKEKENNREISILTDGKKLFLKETKEMKKIELHPESNDLFFNQEWGQTIEFRHENNELIMNDSNNANIPYYKV